MWYVFYEKTIIWRFLCVAWIYLKVQTCKQGENGTWGSEKRKPCFKKHCIICLIWELYGKTTTLEPYRVWTTWNNVMFGQRTKLIVGNGLWLGEWHQWSLWPSAAFEFLTLPNHCWNCIMCLLYVLVSYCLPDIYINRLQAKHFQNIASDNVMNHIKALWHLYSSLGNVLIVCWYSCQ